MLRVGKHIILENKLRKIEGLANLLKRGRADRAGKSSTWEKFKAVLCAVNLSMGESVSGMLKDKLPILLHA